MLTVSVTAAQDELAVASRVGGDDSDELAVAVVVGHVRRRGLVLLRLVGAARPEPVAVPAAAAALGASVRKGELPFCGRAKKRRLALFPYCPAESRCVSCFANDSFRTFFFSYSFQE